MPLVTRVLESPVVSCLRHVLLFALLSVFGCECGTPGLLPTPPSPSLERDDAGMGEDAGLEGTVALRVLGVDPNHGPAPGGNVAVVRGSGFQRPGDLDVRFDGTSVNPLALEVLDGTRIRVAVPAGEPGPADVEVEIGEESATLSDGYLYDQFFVTPNRGSTGGGTFVTITGTGAGFAEGDSFNFGRFGCTALEIVSSSIATCLTPPNAVGPVDVTLVRGSDGSELTVRNAFTYYDTSDPSGGGLGGGPSDGTLNVTVIDADSGEGVPEAYVFIGEDLGGDYTGYTDTFGRVTFSGPDLEAPLTVHVSKNCYESTSFVTFDAQDVTVFVTFLCPDPSPGPPPPGRTPPEQYVEGELIWRGPNEYGPNPWANVPEPREGWERVAYVYETRPCAQQSRFCINPDPGLGVSTPRVLESPTGELGYPYRIFSRTGGLAVYALAGVENEETGEFLPYVMGIARSVLVGPGEVVSEVNVVMDIPLDHYLDVQLDGVPEEPEDEQGRLHVRADIDLAGEGVIVRRHAGEWLDRISARTAERNFRFTAQPALHGALSDGRYRVDAYWEVDPETALITLDLDRPTPRWHAIRRGIREVDTTVVLDTFHGIPTPLAPTPGGRIPADRMLRWEVPGDTPTFYVVYLYDISPMGQLVPLWTLFVNGEQNYARIPNVDPVDGLSDPARQAQVMEILGVTVEGLDFSDVSYADLAENRWSSWAMRFDFVN